MEIIQLHVAVNQPYEQSSYCMQQAKQMEGVGLRIEVWP